MGPGHGDAKHHPVNQALGIEVYLSDPASPWQSGTNENTNGLLRQHFPKGTGLSDVTPTDLRRVEREINPCRPRTFLAGTSAEEAFREFKATNLTLVARRPRESARRQ